MLYVWRKRLCFCFYVWRKFRSIVEDTVDNIAGITVLPVPWFFHTNNRGSRIKSQGGVGCQQLMALISPVPVSVLPCIVCIALFSSSTDFLKGKSSTIVYHIALVEKPFAEETKSRGGIIDRMMRASFLTKQGEPALSLVSLALVFGDPSSIANNITLFSHN